MSIRFLHPVTQGSERRVACVQTSPISFVARGKGTPMIDGDTRLLSRLGTLAKG